MAQRYIPEIADGDKRVLLIAGEPVPLRARAHPEAGRDARQPRRRRPRRRAAAHRARPRDRRGAGPGAVGRGPARRRPRRHRRLPDRGQRDEPDVLRRDRASSPASTSAGCSPTRSSGRRPDAPAAGSARATIIDGHSDERERAAAAADRCDGATTGPTMIGILIIAHDTLGDSLARRVTHVLGSRPPQFEVLSVAATDDPLALLPAGARARRAARHRRRRADLLRHLRRDAVQPRRQAADAGPRRGRRRASTCRCWCARSPTARAAWTR